jgi:hypothetical protein
VARGWKEGSPCQRLRFGAGSKFCFCSYDKEYAGSSSLSWVAVGLRSDGVACRRLTTLLSYCLTSLLFVGPLAGASRVLVTGVWPFNLN